MANSHYGFIATFDKWANYGTIISGLNLRQIDSLDIHQVPNILMQAKETLLAQLLRTGKHVLPPSRSLIAEELPFHVLRQKGLVGRLLGVEIEYYPADRYAVRKTKLVENVGDGSLGNGGREIRKITWQSADGRLQGLLNLKLQGRVDKTCGLHVHVDARHLGRDGLLDANDTYDRLCKFYPFLKSLCPKSRRTSVYCKWTNNRNGCSRYSAINFESFDKHQTLEFRCQGGSIDPLKIETWALLCQFLVNYSARPYNIIPSSWIRFIGILPEPFRTWSVLRKLDLYGSHGSIRLNERSLSGVTIRS